MTAPDRIRLICTDLDGTLLDSSGQVGPVTRRALQEAAACGLPVIGVTGRPLRDALVPARRHGLTGLVVCSNGAVTAEVDTGRVVAWRGFGGTAAGRALTRFRARLPGVVLGADTPRGLLLEPGFASLVPDCWHHRVVPDAVASLPLDDQVVKLLAVHPEVPAPALARPLIRAGDGVQVTRSTPYFLEISPRGVDKAASLRRLADRHRMRITATAAVGDMPNDLPMLLAAGLAAAVANAHPDVLRAADLILPGNDDDGVADLIAMACRSARPAGPRPGGPRSAGRRPGRARSATQ